MRKLFGERFSNDDERFAQHLLSRWRFFVTSGGFFWIQPADPMLPFADLVTLVKRLLRADRDSRFAEIELDFTGTAVVGAPRGATRRLLSEAGRHLGERCRISPPRERNHDPACVVDVGAR
jgi:hypothetical protein